MRVTPPLRLLCSCLYLSLLTLTGCNLSPTASVTSASIHNIEHARPDVALDIAYQLYKQDRLADALKAYHHVRDSASPQSIQYRQALMGIALIHINGEAEGLRDLTLANQQLEQLNDAVNLTRRELSTSESMMIDAVRQLVTTESRQLALREELEGSRQTNAELAREKQQLEEALARLRRLTLE